MTEIADTGRTNTPITEATDNDSPKRAGLLKRYFLPKVAYKTKKDDIESEVKTGLMGIYGIPEDLAEKYADCISGDTEQEPAVSAAVDYIDNQIWVVGSVNNVIPERTTSIKKLYDNYKKGLIHCKNNHLDPTKDYDHNNAQLIFDGINVLEEVKEIWKDLSEEGIPIADYGYEDNSTKYINVLMGKRAIKTDIDNTIGSIDYLHSKPKKASNNAYIRDGVVVGGIIGALLLYKYLTGDGDPPQDRTPTVAESEAIQNATDTITPSGILDREYATCAYAKTPSGTELYIGTGPEGLGVVTNPVLTEGDNTTTLKADQIIYIPPNMNVSDVITSLEMIARS